MRMVAPHVLKESLVLRAKERAGLFKLVATDATGGVMTAYGGAEQPAAGDILSFLPVDEGFGPVRLLARALEPVEFPGTVTLHVAVHWVAVTTPSAAHLARILAVMGVRVHLPPGVAEAMKDGRELVYEPLTQRVRMIDIRQGHVQQPTADLATGIAETITRTQLGILVETVAADESRSWNRPGDPRPDDEGAANSSTSAGQRIDSRRTSTGRWSAGRPPEDARTSAEAGKDGAGELAPSGSGDNPGCYRIGNDATAPPADRVAPETRDRSAGSMAPLPEFERDHAPGEVSVGGASFRMICVSLGQRSCTFEMPDHGVAIGAAVTVGVPADPLETGLMVWVPGSLERIEQGGRPGLLRLQVRLQPTVPRAYRRLVQYWSRLRQRR